VSLDDGEPILDPSRQLKTAAQGAATQVWCATSAQLHDIGGMYPNRLYAPLTFG
jgi:hypothetical protein